MMDGDDLEFAALVAPAGILGLIIVIVVAIIVWNNEVDCSKMSCADGKQARLMENACLCVEVAQ